MTRLSIALALLSFAACGDTAAPPGSGDASVPADMATPACIATTTPTSSSDLLNACTRAQSGDPAKDVPYFPTRAPAGVLPSLP